MSRSSSSNKEHAKGGLRDNPVAIIGLAGIFPEAHNLQEYWDNILNKINCIIDVPASRWKIEDYYDPDPSVPDKTYCKRGGFIPDIDFDPMEFGLPLATMAHRRPTDTPSSVISQVARSIKLFFVVPVNPCNREVEKSG